jgi:hypothetical protein
MGIGAALNAGHSTTSHGSIASAMGSLNASHASLNCHVARCTDFEGRYDWCLSRRDGHLGMPTATPAHPGLIASNQREGHTEK